MNLRVLTTTVAAATVITLTGCAVSGESAIRIDTEADFETTEDSGEPNLFATSDGTLLLSWIARTETGHAVQVAARENGQWSTPQTAYESDKLFVNWADFPSVTATTDGTWLVHWLEKVADATYAYHVRVSQSEDQGGTWSPPITIHQDTSPTEHGFLSMVPDAAGGVSMIWLDGRKTGGPDRGPMALWGTSIDKHGQVAEEKPVDEMVCDCCQTALVRANSGLVAAYRDRTEGEIRDIAVRYEEDGGWSEPTHVGNDNWYITGCPVNGPSLSAVGDTVAIAWFTAPEREGKVQVAFSLDGGRHFGEAIQVDDGSPLGRVDIELIDGNTAVVSWLERNGEEAVVAVRTVETDGTASSSRVLVTTSQARQSGFPRLARLGDQIFFAHRAMNGEVGSVKVSAVELN